MTPVKNINIQKGKDIPKRLQTSSNSENEVIENYIQSRIKIRKNLQEQENKKHIPKELIEKIKKQVVKEIEDTLKE